MKMIWIRKVFAKQAMGNFSPKKKNVFSVNCVRSIQPESMLNTQKKNLNRAGMLKMNVWISDEEEEGLVEEEEAEEGATSARPRRMSEVNAATKTQPIPAASSFFVFSQTNRFYDFIWFLLSLSYHMYMNFAFSISEFLPFLSFFSNIDKFFSIFTEILFHNFFPH